MRRAADRDIEIGRRYTHIEASAVAALAPLQRSRERRTMQVRSSLNLGRPGA